MIPHPELPRRWLVTGAGGQLGRSFLAAARCAGCDAIGLDRDALDICDAGAVSAALDQHRPDAVLNAAAFTAVDRCEAEFDHARRVNGDAAAALARLCAGRALLVQISTDYVFPGRSKRPPEEDDAPEPLNAYGRSKLLGEQGVRAAGGEHLLVRSQWLFGPGPNFVRSILAAAARGEALRVVDDERGRPTWTGSLALALLDVARSDLRGTLHLASQGIASRHEFACEIVREGARRGWLRDAPIEPILRADLGRPAARPEHAALSLTRASGAGIVMPHWRDALICYLDAEEVEPGWRGYS